MKKFIVYLSIMLLTNTIFAQEVGLQLYSLRNELKKNVPETLALINKWGITKVEGKGSYGLPMNEFKDLLEQNNLKMVGIVAGFKDLQHNLDNVIKEAKSFGAEYIMCGSVPRENNKWGLKETKHAVEVFNKTGKMLKEHGLYFVYHTHGYEFRRWNNATLFDFMAQNAINFTFELDVFWTQFGGADPLALLKKYPTKFTLLHLKDLKHGIKGNNTGKADGDTNVVLGQGQIDIAGIVAEAKKIGIKYMFIEDESSTSTIQIPKSLLFLESLE